MMRIRVAAETIAGAAISSANASGSTREDMTESEGGNPNEGTFENRTASA
jgi:hypothetical protein